jgi:hypothetical protein
VASSHPAAVIGIALVAASLLRNEVSGKMAKEPQFNVQKRCPRLGQKLSTEGYGVKRCIWSRPQGIEDIPGGKAMHLWGKVIRIQVLPWGEAIENY